MGRRNIYIPRGREGLYDEATLMAGSLSAAIDKALELWVRDVQAGWARAAEVTLPVGRGRQLRHKCFRAIDLGDYPLAEPHRPGRLDGVRFFQGPSGRIAGWRYSDPDWSQMRLYSGGELTDPLEPDDWFERWGVELQAFDEVDAALAHFGVHEKIAEAVRRRTRYQVVETWDL